MVKIWLAWSCPRWLDDIYNMWWLFHVNIKRPILCLYLSMHDKAIITSMVFKLSIHGLVSHCMISRVECGLIPPSGTCLHQTPPGQETGEAVDRSSLSAPLTCGLLPCRYVQRTSVHARIQYPNRPELELLSVQGECIYLADRSQCILSTLIHTWCSYIR